MRNIPYRKLFRLVLTGLVFLGVFIFMNMLIKVVLPITVITDKVRPFLSFAIAIGVAKMIWIPTKRVKAPVATYGIIGAMVFGSIGFIGGFLGPIILRPDSPQGPLLGVFFTGPIGFLLGLVGGIIYGLKVEKVQRK